MTPHIRAAGPDDVGAVLAAWTAARSTGADVEDTPEDYARLLERSPGGVLVAEEDGRIVGTVIAVWDGWRGAIARLCVLPTHRRKGIGRALVDAGEESLRAEGCSRVNVLIFEEDEGAGDLWTSRDYVTNPSIQRYWRDL